MYSNETNSVFKCNAFYRKHICIQYESIPIKQWKERKLRSVFDVETGYVVKWSPFFVRPRRAPLRSLSLKALFEVASKKHR